jgi:predicted ATP-grasp superfamily ATP-dependent carboligase
VVNRIRPTETLSHLVFRTTLALVTLCLFSISHADPAPSAIIVPDLDGTPHHPLDPENNRANVLFFIRTDCPISNTYAPEITRLQKQYASQKIAFYLVYTLRDLTPAAAREHLKQYNLAVPALIDRKHELVKATGATVTIEAAVIGPNGSLLYRGRIDDLYAALGKPRTVPTTHELRDALDAIVNNKQPPTPRTKAIGCAITDD